MTALTLKTASRLGLIGDAHGDLGALLSALRTLRTQDVTVAVQLGDFGWPWPHTQWGTDLAKLDRRLNSLGMSLYIVDGNHDWHEWWAEQPVADDGLQWVRPRIARIPRGWRTTLASGSTLAALGGAGSVDRSLRGPDSWWAGERISDDDLRALGDDRVDILLGHDAPRTVALQKHLERSAGNWDLDDVLYAEDCWLQFNRGFRAVRPSLSVGGHYHVGIDETGEWEGDDGVRFTCRSVVLDMIQHPKTASVAVLDVQSLELRYWTVGGRALATADATAE